LEEKSTFVFKVLVNDQAQVARLRISEASVVDWQ
jgi:hypothetical protein